MKWPTHTDYQDAIQNPQVCFQDTDLKAGTTACDMLGLPRVMSGNFASVYELTTPTGRWAIRCFVRHVMGQQGRYARLSQYLAPIQFDALVKFEYILKGIRIQADWFPLVKMEWVQGKQLNSYVEDHVQDPETLRQLAQRWRAMLGHMRKHKIAHGDLQHGNVMVTDAGELRLVDYDGMYCPAFGRGRSPELGHANFQHPRRTPDWYDERLDSFAALGIYLSFLALACEPDLWATFYTGDNLILSADDYRNTQHSRAFDRLKASSDPNVSALASFLQQCCIAPIECTPWFEDVLSALEKGTLAELTAAVVNQTSASPPTPSGAPAWIEPPHTPAPKPEVKAEPVASPKKAAPVPASITPVSTVQPSLVRASEDGEGSKLWLRLAAVVVVVVIGMGAYFLWGNKKPQGSVPASTSPGGVVTQPGAGAGATPRTPNVIAPVTHAIEGRPLAPQAGAIGWLGFASDSHTLAVGGEDGGIQLWDSATGARKTTFAGVGDGVHAATLLPGGKTIACVSGDNTLRYWNVGSPQPAKTIGDYTKNLWAISLAPDGLTLAAGAADRKIVRLLDPQTGALRKMLPPHASWVRSVDFSPDSKLVAVSCWDDTVKIWVTASGDVRQTLTVLSNSVEGVQFSPDNRLVAAGGMGHTVKLWDSQSGALKQTLIGLTGDARSYAFSASGRTLAAGGADKTVRVWDIASGQLRQTLAGHTDAVISLAFAADGRTLASGSADQSVRLWDVSQLNP